MPFEKGWKKTGRQEKISPTKAQQVVLDALPTYREAIEDGHTPIFLPDLGVDEAFMRVMVYREWVEFYDEIGYYKTPGHKPHEGERITSYGHPAEIIPDNRQQAFNNRLSNVRRDRTKSPKWRSFPNPRPTD